MIGMLVIGISYFALGISLAVRARRLRANTNSTDPAGMDALWLSPHNGEFVAGGALFFSSGEGREE